MQRTRVASSQRGADVCQSVQMGFVFAKTHQLEDLQQKLRFSSFGGSYGQTPFE